MLTGAIIGFGKIAQNSHMPAFQQLSKEGKLKITAVVEPDEINRNNSSEKYSNIKFYSSSADLFKSEQLDFVDITSPPLFHANNIEEAIDNDIHIICEKPFTFNLQEAKKISFRLNNSNIVFMPCHQYKYSPLWIYFKQFINQASVESKFILQCSVYRTEADLGLPVFNNPWRINKNISGGGILSDTGIHYLYLAAWLLGKPKKVTAKTFNLKHKYKVEDTAYLILEHEYGISEISLTWAAGLRANSASLTNNCGSIVYNDGKQLKKQFNDSEEIISIPDVSDKATYNKLYIDLFEEFIENILSNHDSSKYIKEAFDSIYLLEKCYESASEQKTILLNE